MDKESYIINRFHSQHIGDDGAVIGEYVYSMDAFYEGTHFKRTWLTPTQIGRKAMLVNLSDAVAMNADPLYALVTLGVPDTMPKGEIDALSDALQTTAESYGCEIIGGDTVKSDKLHITIALISRTEQPLLRTGLQEGDLLAFTGTLGESARDLARLFRGETIEASSRFINPILRDGFVCKARPWLRAGMDISDGLFCDTNKLLETNGIGCEILKNITKEEGLSGEEYEMLVAFGPNHEAAVRAVAQDEGVALTIFARVTDNDYRFPCKSHHFSEE